MSTNPIWRRAAAGLAVLATTATLVWLWLSPSGIAVAPALRLATIDGRNIDLADLGGSPVLVDFWATTCHGCVREMPELMGLHREFAPRGFTVIGIAMDYDPPDQVRRMAADRGIPYPVVLDTGGAAARAFGGVMLTPTHFLVAPDGRIAMQVIGEIDFAAVRARLRDWLRG